MDYYDDVIRVKKKKDYGADELGEDLVLEILLKLPVKYVLRCRCVSKTWYDLTKAADFITRHRIQHQAFDDDNRCMMFLNIKQPDGYHVSTNRKLGFSLIRDDEETISILRFPLFSFVEDIKEIFVIGSCNGLIYLNMRIDIHRDVHRGTVYQQVIVVWNPATEQYRILPKPNTKLTNISFDKDQKDDIVSVNFMNDNSLVPLVGFAFVDGEYKVTRIFCERKRVFQAQVFVPNTNSWRAGKNELRFKLFRFSYPESSIMLNGVLYWKVVCKNKEGSRYVCVMSFDLRDEAFKVIELPARVQDRCGACLRLYSWRNSLAYFTRDYETMWVMNYINNNKIMVWMKLTFGDNILGNARECLGFWKNDEFLFTRPLNSDDNDFDDLLRDVPNSVVSYHIESHAEKYIIKHTKGMYISQGVLNYVQTLVPVE